MIKPRYILIAIILYLVVAYCSLGNSSPDEYYQILEFASYKLGFGDVKQLTWEYHYQIRPAMQVWFAVMVYKLLAYFSITNPFTSAFVLRLFSCILSLVATFTFIKAFLPSIKYDTSKKWFILLSLFTWLILYNSARYSSENISEKLFLLGFSLLFIPKFNRSLVMCMIMGLLMGLSFDARFQNMILIGGLYVWFVTINNSVVIGGENKRIVNIAKIAAITLGILIAIGLGLLMDKWFYGNWVFTPWNYLYMNLFQGRASSFGSQPWWFYSLVLVLLPYGPFYIISTFVSIKYKPKNPVVWLIILYTLVHTLIGHKELRFLIPILCFMPLVIAYSIDILLSSLGSSFERYTFATNARLEDGVAYQKSEISSKRIIWIRCWKWMWYFNCFCLIFSAVLPSGTGTYLCKVIYEKYTQPMQFYAFTEGGNELDFYKRKNVKIIYVNDHNEVKCDENKVCLLALTCQQAKTYQGIKGKVVYNNCPNWLLKLNFFGWLDRTAIYNVYQLN